MSVIQAGGAEHFSLVSIRRGRKLEAGGERGLAVYFLSVFWTGLEWGEAAAVPSLALGVTLFISRFQHPLIQ